MAYKLILDKDSIWSKIFKANLESLPWKAKKKHRRLGYSFMDKLAFSKPSNFGKLQYTKNIWNAWMELRQYLTYNIDGNKLPHHWGIGDAMKILPSIFQYTEQQQARIAYFFGRIQVTTVKDLWDNQANNWKNFDVKLEEN
jgi:hypothetical protein